MRARVAVFLTIVSSILFLGQAFVYRTWIDFLGPQQPWQTLHPQLILIALPMSFVAASLLARRYANLAVRLLYTLSAVWLGVLTLSIVAACACWSAYAGQSLLGLHLDLRPLAAVFFGLAGLASLYGIVNAAWPRVTRITVKLPNLPETWRGRVAALVTDAHLGPVRTAGFLRRIVGRLRQFRPDIVFIAGDLYDGSAANPDRLAEPLTDLAPPLGSYFIAGNHEEFSDRRKYLEALERSGVRVLDNEKVIVDGLQILGVHHSAAGNPERLRSIFRRAALDRGRASILLTHAPTRLRMAEEEGISLQLCGHTHGGQLFPWTLLISRVFGAYSRGLNRFGNLAVYTSTGAGTWGPPMRVGSPPEIAMICFE